MPRYPTNNPVYAGSNTMACIPGGTWQVWWLKSGTSVDTTVYTTVSFWPNGETTGGQTVLVSGETNGAVVFRLAHPKPFKINGWLKLLENYRQSFQAIWAKNCHEHHRSQQHFTTSRHRVGWRLMGAGF